MAESLQVPPKQDTSPNRAVSPPPKNSLSVAKFFGTKKPSQIDLNTSKKDAIIWKQNAFLELSEHYSKLIRFLTENLTFAKIFADCVTSTDADSFASIIVKIFNSVGRTLPLIKAMIELEFIKASKDSQGAILRGNNIISKIEGIYVRGIGNQYLIKTVKDFVDEIIAKVDLSFEIDIKKIKALTSEGKEKLIKTNLMNLKNYTQKFLTRIMDSKTIEEMPREIRAICGYTCQCAMQYSPDTVAPLIGGFLMLRYFSPAIVTPESYGILSNETIPSIQARRNLVLLTKVLQNVSNGVLFSNKEEYMIPMNEFIEENKEKMQEYLLTVARDPLAKEGFIPWSDLEPNGPVQEIKITSGDLPYLFELHRTVDNFLKKVIPALQEQKKISIEEEKKSQTWKSAKIKGENEYDQLINLLQELGPPPKRTKKEKEPSKSEIDLLQTSTVIDLQNLDRLKFLYQGPPNKENQPVVYFIANRFREELLQEKNALILIEYVNNILKTASNGNPYVIVFDMSWVKITSELKKSIYGTLPKLIKSINKDYKRTISTLYVVHPSAFTRAVTYFMKTLSSKSKLKIHELYDWKHLSQFIELNNILLPETSKDFITTSYQVTKVNSKGKHQERLLKFTNNSILNIDPKTKKILNEKKLVEIEEIFTFQESLEIHLQFKQSSKFQITKKQFMKSEADQFFRKYICKCNQDRDDILQDFFRCGFDSARSTLPQEYRVIKVNNTGKRQERLLKVTSDSLLNIDYSSGRIKSEISFAGVEDISLDSNEKNVIWLKFKAEEKKRKIICVDFSNELYQVLQDCMEKYQAVAFLDETNEKTNVAAELEIHATN